MLKYIDGQEGNGVEVAGMKHNKKEKKRFRKTKEGDGGTEIDTRDLQQT